MGPTPRSPCPGDWLPQPSAVPRPSPGPLTASVTSPGPPPSCPFGPAQSAQARAACSDGGLWSAPCLLFTLARVLPELGSALRGQNLCSLLSKLCPREPAGHLYPWVLTSLVHSPRPLCCCAACPAVSMGLAPSPTSAHPLPSASPCLSGCPRSLSDHPARTR